MSTKTSSSLVTLFVGASLALSLGAFNASAATRDRQVASTAPHRVHNAYSWRVRPSWHPRPYVVRTMPVPVYDYNHPNESAPGYVFVPGKGILNESCDLPSSTCSNEYRDIE